MKTGKLYRTSSAWFLGLVIVIAGSGFVASGLNGLAAHRYPVAVLALAVGLGTMVTGFKWAPMGVARTEEGVLVHNCFSTKTVPWSDISRFVTGEELPHPKSDDNLYVLLADGRHIQLMAFSGYVRQAQRTVERVAAMVKELDAERQERSSSVIRHGQ